MVSPQRGSGTPKRETPGGGQRSSPSGAGKKGTPGRGATPPGVIVDQEYANAPVPVSVPELPVASDDPLVGTVLHERYLILERLSQGGMGVVYKARHMLLDAPVAIKILLEQRDPVAQKRFLLEAKLASKVHHPNTVYISDFGVLPDPDGRLYLVMELLRGPTLSRAISGGRLELLRACQLALQMMTGLQAIHDAGIIHRDLKPENIFLIQQGKEEGDDQHELVKIVDFGIATRTGKTRSDPTVSTEGKPPAVTAAAAAAAMGISSSGNRLTVAGVVMGTPLYMSPEQVEGRDLDTRSDQYALGCIFYEMLTGTVPFEGATPEAVMVKHLHIPPVPPEERCPEAGISRRLSSLILRCLAKERTNRFPSLQELSKELQNEIARLQVSRGEKVLITKSAADVFKMSRRARLIGAAGLGLLLLGGGFLTVRHFLSKPAVEQVVQLQPGEALAARREAITLLTTALADTNPQVRSAAVAALGLTRDSGLRPRIEPLLADPAPEVQASAAMALALLGDRGAIAALSTLREKSTLGGVRVAAAAALDQLGEQAGSLALRQALESGDDQARLKAALLLCDRGEPRARTLLSSAVKNPKLPEEAAITLLARLGQTGDSAARSELAQRMTTSGRRDVQLLAAAKLVQLGDDRGRAFLRTVVQKRDQEQLPAARLLAAPDEQTGLDVLRRVIGDKHASPGERLLAIEGLGQASRVIDVRTLKPLLTPATGGDQTVSRAAAAAIVKLTAGEPGTLSEQSLGWARLALNDSDWVVRESAALVLGDAASPQAADLLATLARDKEAYVRRAAVRALSRRGEMTGIGVLRTRLTDGDSGVRVEALRGLAQLAGALLKRGSTELIAELTSALKSALDRGTPEEQLLSRVVLLRLGDNVQKEALRSWLSSDDIEQRRLLIENAGSDVDLLRGALTDDSVELRLLAARKLAALHDSRALPVLREAMAQGGVAALQAYSALRQLGEMPQKPAALKTEPTDATNLTPQQRMKVVEALVELPPTDALPGLRRAARDPDPRVRQQAAEVAAGLPANGGEPLGAQVLRLLLDDPDMAVRARAAALLSRILRPATPEPATEQKAEPAAPTPPEPQAPGNVEETPPVSKQSDELPIKQLLQIGTKLADGKDFAKAEQTLDKAQRGCARERKPSPGCNDLAFEISYQLGRAHEGQRRPAEAMVDYENAIKLALKRRSKPGHLRDAQDAVLELVPRLGVVVVPKVVQKTCREVSLWMEPGQHEIQVNGHREVVEVRARETKKVGSCPTGAP